MMNLKFWELTQPIFVCPEPTPAIILYKVNCLRGMGEVCAAAGCTMLLAVHNKKGKVDPYSPPELEDIAWAGFQEYFRQWLLVGRRERYEPGTGDHHLWLNVGGMPAIPHSGPLTWPKARERHPGADSGKST